MPEIIIIVISSKPALEDFKTKAAIKFRVEDKKGGIEIFDNAGDRMLITGPGEKPGQKYEKQDLMEKILSLIKTPYYYYFRYESKRLMKELAPLIFEGEQMVIDIGSGVLVESDEFCYLMQMVSVRNESIKNEGGVNFYCNTEWIKNEVCFKPVNIQYDFHGLFNGVWRPAGGMEVKIRSGKRFNDIVFYYGDPANFAISERLRQILIDEGITGWDTYDLTIVDCDLKYYGFIVTGRCAPLPAKVGNDREIGYTIKDWDGSDFFCPQETSRLVFSQKAKDIFTKHDIRRVKLVDTRDLERY